MGPIYNGGNAEWGIIEFEYVNGIVGELSKYLSE